MGVLNLQRCNIPNFVFSTYKILVINNCIIGNYFTIKYFDNLQKIYPDLPPFIIHIFNFVIHILPLILIYFSENQKIKQKEIIPSLTIILIQSLTYLYLNNPKKVYDFTAWSNNKLISVYLISFIICFFVYQNKIQIYFKIV